MLVGPQSKDKDILIGGLSPPINFESHFDVWFDTHVFESILGLLSPFEPVFSSLFGPFEPISGQFLPIIGG